MTVITANIEFFISILILRSNFTNLEILNVVFTVGNLSEMRLNNFTSSVWNYCTKLTDMFVFKVFSRLSVNLVLIKCWDFRMGIAYFIPGEVKKNTKVIKTIF